VAPEHQSVAEDSSRWRKALIAGGLVGVAAVAVAFAAVILLSGGSTNAGAAYRQKLTATLAPVLVANDALSSSLQSLNATNTAAAQSATSQAQAAIVGARGAVAVLTVPGASTQLSQQTQQALAQESGYLQAVSATLAAPTSSNAAQLQPLASSASSALVPLASVAPGIQDSLTGTDNLNHWVGGAVAQGNRESAAAARATAAAQRRAVAQAAQSGASQGSRGTTTIVTPVAPTPVAPTPVTPSSGGFGTYSLVSGLTGTAYVRAGPSASAAIVAQIDPSAQVTILCTSHGGPVTYKGSTGYLWDQIASPAGYISDALVQTGSPNAVAPDCGS
jgi:hypothetical protein